MKFKLDENLDARLAALFAEGGHEASTVRDEGLGGGDDDTIYDVCRAERRVLVSLDLDFSNPVRFPPGPTEGVVVFRPRYTVLPMIERIVRDAVPTLKTSPLKGKLWIVEPGRIRVYDPNEATE